MNVFLCLLKPDWLVSTGSIATNQQLSAFHFIRLSTPTTAIGGQSYMSMDLRDDSRSRTHLDHLEQDFEITNHVRGKGSTISSDTF